MKQTFISLDDYIKENYHHLNESAKNLIKTSKIGSYWCEENGEICFGYRYKSFHEESTDQPELWGEDFEGSVGNLQEYHDELKNVMIGGYQILNNMNVEEKEKFCRDQESAGLFSGETYNGWDFFSDIPEDTPPALKEKQYEESVTKTVLYIIAKIEIYFDWYNKNHIGIILPK